MRREEDEFQRALTLSMQDQGGPLHVTPFANSSASQSAPPEAPQQLERCSTAHPYVSTPLMQPAADMQPREPAPAQAPRPEPAFTTSHATAPSSGYAVPTTTSAPDHAYPLFVRALYDFEPSEPGELAFAKGDVIRVLDSVYQEWWRGELRLAVGIFPVNYVEALPNPTPDAIQQELDLEQAVFAHASDIQLLHARLQQLRPGDNFVDDEELQELYQRALALRPKIVRLIDRYSAKVHELRAMNDKFVQARTTLDQLINEHVERVAAPSIVAKPATAEPSPVEAPAGTSVAAAPEAPSFSMPSDDEKRRLYERAVAETEAYQRKHFPDDAANDLAGLRL